MKAHDVRHLVLCPTCGSIGDKREMIVIRPRAYVHSGCLRNTMSRVAMLKLPSAELGKLRLCDLPAKEMLSVLEELRRRSQENAA